VRRCCAREDLDLGSILFHPHDGFRRAPRAFTLCASQRGSAVEPIHVSVSGAPGLMREIVMQAVTSQPDMRIVDGREGVSPSVSRAPEEDGPDVVVVILHDVSDASIDAVVARAFSTRAVVAVDTLGGSVWSYDYELRRSTRLAGEVTPTALVEAIRVAAERMGVSHKPPSTPW
jgi:hypothetical protein